MTRSNLHIKLSNGKQLICVAESSSAPEQGYIVEQVILPLLALNDAEKEMTLLHVHCTMNDRRTNATYRYFINLSTKSVHFFGENYDEKQDCFFIGDNLTNRYYDYLYSIQSDQSTHSDQHEN